jgi:PAS domain S-box-containing protein
MTVVTNALPSHERLAFKVIETADQRASLRDSIRKEMLRVLMQGQEDFAIETKTEQRTLDDGTRITEDIRVEKPIRRYWMTVPEILESIRIQNPSLSLATTKAYYHIRQLQEQGLIEQHPPKTGKGTKGRVRGMHFRTAAKFFVDVTVEASVGYPGSAVMPLEIGPRFLELAIDVRESGVAASMEYQVDLDGVLLWVSMTMNRHADGLNIVGVIRDITTHRTLEERLERSEVEFGRLVEESFQGYAIFQDGAPVFVNPAYANIVGYKLSELTRMSSEDAWKMVHPEDRPILEERNREITLGAEELPRIRFRHVRPDGSIRWVDSFGRKTEHLGRPALLALEIDITEQIEAERALRLTQFSIDHASDPIFWVGADGKFTYTNDAACRILQYSREELQDMGVNDIDESVLDEGWQATLDRVREAQALTFETTITTKEKSYVPVEVSVQRLEFEGQEIFFAFMKDITSRREADRALRESEERYRLLYENLSDGLIISDINGNITMASPQASMLFLATPEEVIGKHITTFIHPDQIDEIMVIFQDSLATQNPMPEGIEVHGLRLDGSEFYYHVTNKVLLENGESVGYQSLIRDITDRKTAEESVRRNERRFREIFDSSPVAIGRCGLEGEFLELNQAFMDLFGISEANYDPDYRLSKDPHMPKWALDKIAKGELVVFDVTYSFDLAQARNIFKTTRTGTAELVATLAPLNLPANDPEAGYLIMVQDVTDQVRAEEALRESEERYRTFFDQAGDSILISDPLTSEILDFNRQAHESLGYSEEEFRNLKLWEIDIVEDEAAIEERMVEIAEKGSLVFESKHKTKTGEIKDVRVSTRIVMHRDRMINQAIITDITDSKIAEEALRESEERYRTLVETIPGVFIKMDSSGNFTYVSPQIEGMMHETQEEFLKREPLSRMHVDDVDHVRKAIASLFETGEPFQTEYRAQRKDGSWICVEVRAIGITEKDGKVQASGILTDVTERKLNQEALRESEERFRGIIEHIEEVFYIVDAEDGFVYLSPQSKQIIGYEPDEIVGMSMEEFDAKFLTDNSVNKGTRERTDRTFAGERSPPYHQELFRKDRSKVFLEIRESPQFDDKGKIIAVFGAARDITKQRRDEEALKASEERYRSLFDSSVDPIFWIKDGKVIEVNPAAMMEFGYTKEEFLGKTPWGISPRRQPDGLTSKAKATAVIEEALKGTPQLFNWRHRRSDGTDFDVFVSVTAARVNGEEILQAILREKLTNGV